MPLTRPEFVGQFRNELLGMILDAALSQRTGGELALSIRGCAMRIDTILGTIYDTLAPEPIKAPEPTKQPPQRGR